MSKQIKNRKRYEKGFLVECKEIYGYNFYVVKNWNVVFCWKRTGGNMLKVSWSICSDNDEFKKREGKFIAANRMIEGNFLPVRAYKGAENEGKFIDIFENIARII